MQQATLSTKKTDIQRAWHLIDVTDRMLGRVSSEVAQLLMGKSKPYFVRNMDCGDYVVVINAKEVKVTGKKSQDKKYTRHSGYPGGLRTETFNKMMVRKPEFIIEHAIKGMLPGSKLGRQMIKKLTIFAGEIE